MSDSALRYLSMCPVGCSSELETTQYSLPEGALLRCSACVWAIDQSMHIGRLLGVHARIR